MTKYVDIVFDGPPSPESGRFIEVENQNGESINFGEWIKRPDGYWSLRVWNTHTHVAGTVSGRPIDECAKCGHLIRHPVHVDSKHFR